MRSLALPYVAILGVLCGMPPARAANSVVSEPFTVFYGKVLGTGSAQNFMITTGKLTWVIQRSDGVRITLKTSLYSFQDGEYSYRLDVPHSAFNLGLETDPNGLPLPPSPQTHLHAEVRLDGDLVTLLGPAGSSFTTEQLLRTATYRLDLGVGRAAVDTDGDGIPDWWEDLYGLDKQDPFDAAADLSGDGLSALQAYLRGLDPHRDRRLPALVTKELIVYPSGSTGILLDTADLDSAPSQLVYTVTSLPLSGALKLRDAVQNPANPDETLEIGGHFTQQDLLKGRVIYDHDGSEREPGSFGVSVRDEDPAHAADEGTVRLLAYVPAEYQPAQMTDAESQRLDNHFYAENGYVILDASAMPSNTTLATPSAGLSNAALASFQTSYGNDRPYLFVGSRGAQSALTGGHRDDVFYAGKDAGRMTGGLGADLFVFKNFAAGVATITDFSPASGDVIDLSRIPAVAGSYAQNYLRIAAVGSTNRLQVDLDGDGAGFTNLNIVLPGLAAASADLYTLVEGGNLLIGPLRLEPRVSVTASIPQASENGPTAGRFTLVRQGSLDGDVTVNVAWSGTAQNGTDYPLQPSTFVMPAGVASLNVDILPFADGVTEPTESVQLTVLAGTGYRVGAANQATVTIEDLLMLIEIEALEPVAVKDTASPGLFLITRRDVINRDVIVRLNISGTASNGVDYTTLPAFVVMGINQTVALIQVTPKATATLVGGMETVDLTIKPDAAYRVTGAGQARVSIVERLDSFAGWRAREFPSESGDVAAFASADSGARGVTHLQRYAFGMDPHNPDRGELHRAFLHNGRLVVSFRKPLNVTDVQYRVRAATNLMNWNGSSVAVSPIAAPDGSSDPERVYYEVGSEADAADTVFSVIEVELTP